MTEKDDTRIQLGPVIQVGFVVHDVEATMAAWLDRFELGKSWIVDWPRMGTDQAVAGTYHGRPATFRMRLGFIETESIQIEFIQPLEGENIYADFFRDHDEGLHHLLFSVPDPEGVARQLEVPILLSGGSTMFPGAIFAYLDTQEMLKTIVELRTKMEE